MAKKPTPTTDSEPAPAEARKAPKKSAAAPSIDAVARAAYLNYRRRVDEGLPGDASDDWLQAERQMTVSE